MAISWPSQLNRIYRDDVLKTSVFIMNTQLPGDTQRREHVCLPLDVLPGWLFGISTARVKPELQEKLKRYRRECFRVLWEAFKPQILREEVTLASADVDPAIQELQRIAEMGRAIAQLAEQQIELQRQQQALTQRLDKAGRVVRGMQIDIADIQVRLGSVENKLHPQAYITDEQAAHVSQLGARCQVSGVRAGAARLSGLEFSGGGLIPRRRRGGAVARVGDARGGVGGARC